jgi:hypothetical protein
MFVNLSATLNVEGNQFIHRIPPPNQSSHSRQQQILVKSVKLSWKSRQEHGTVSRV